MRQAITYGCLILLAVILQGTVIPTFIADPFKPNLLLVLVVYLGLRSERLSTAAGVYCLGLLHDSLSGLYLGLNAFAYMATFLILQHLAGRLYVQRANVLIFCVIIATAGVALVHVIFLSLFLTAPGIFLSVVIGLVPQMAVNALVASLVPFMPVVGRRLQLV
jgi:rod shape-determining protein MreD